MNQIDDAILTVCDRVKAAAADGTALAIQGGGSKRFYTGALGGEVLDTRPLGGILSYEPSELVLTAGAGTSLQEVEETLAACGQYLPFEPPHFARGGEATLGGMVASALSGPARASAGGVRDYVLGIKMVNGMGQALRFGGQVMKNVAGYDVSRLLVGSLGTLGVLTEISLKVMPRPVAEATLQFALDQTAALDLLHSWGAQPLPLNASCWTHTAQDGPALYVRLRGALAAVESASRQMSAQAGGTVVTEQSAEVLWEGLRNQTNTFFKTPAPEHAHAQLWRLSVPQTAPPLHLSAPVLVEWHGGLRWVWADSTEADSLTALASSVGGSAAQFIQTPGAPSPQTQVDRLTQDALMRRLKASFDPQGIFNPSLTPDANPSRP